MKKLLIGLFVLMLSMSATANDLSVVHYDTIVAADKVDMNVDTIYTSAMDVRDLTKFSISIGWGKMSPGKNWASDTLMAAELQYSLDKQDWRTMATDLITTEAIAAEDTIIFSTVWFGRDTGSFGNWVRLKFSIQKDTLATAADSALVGDVFMRQYSGWFTTVKGK